MSNTGKVKHSIIAIVLVMPSDHSIVLLQVHVNAELVCACVYVNIFLENGKYMKQLSSGIFRYKHSDF